MNRNIFRQTHISLSVQHSKSIHLRSLCDSKRRWSRMERRHVSMPISSSLPSPKSWNRKTKHALQHDSLFPDISSLSIIKERKKLLCCKIAFIAQNSASTFQAGTGDDNKERKRWQLLLSTYNSSEQWNLPLGFKDKYLWIQTPS